jgi:2-desacetyl-2-hydroxyethyl bacteriochlorophyllide A dehydrogenase
MKAALLVGPEKIVMDDVAEPYPAADEVMIQPECAGICGTDVSFYLGHRIVPYPFVLGHEVIGRIAAVGRKVEKFQVGQRVIVEPNYPCGSCALCLAGRGAICPQKKSMGVNTPGCFAEYAAAPAEYVWALPDNVSDQDAATIEPLAVSMHGLLQSGAQKGDSVAVLGCGVVGLLLIHAATAAGIRVIAHDRFANKLEMARLLGATPAPADEDASSLWQKENATSIFECAGAPATVDLALNAAPRGAQVILLGLSSAPASFNPLRFVREGINIRTSMIYDHPADFARVIDQVARGVLHPARIVTHTYPFESLSQALAHAATGEAGKIHIKMGQPKFRGRIDGE